MKRVVTENEIQRLVQGTTVRVERDMILTPSAREYAARKGLTLQYVQDRAQPQQAMDGDALGRLIEEVVVQELARSPSPQLDPSPPAAPTESPSLGTALDRAIAQVVLDRTTTDQESEARAVIAVIGRNRTGIVAKISAVVAETGGDLADMSQVIVDEYFSLIFLVNLSGLGASGVTFRVFKERLLDEASLLGDLEVMVMHEKIFHAMHEV